ncbi:helicase-associated domain-containing protein [Kineococcus sp. SYSU DK004]|uniref:helicase-associated domain-containing protein n=1 Tax=Kineococcus sp. SYSU DK004 TaxID=3383125 RepID=UPI003D7E9DCD
MPAATPRTLAEDLRARPDDGLEELLALRPDLVSPLPTSTTALAARATTRASVQRALDALDSPALQVAEVLAVLPGPVGVGAVSRAWGAKAGEQVDRLRRRALVWGTDRRLHLVHAVRDLLGPHPAGLGPSLADALGRRSPQRLAELLEDLGLEVSHDPETALPRLAAHLGDADVLAGLLEPAPEGVRALLDRLTWGPPTGAVERADRQVRTATSSTPVDWLLARGLLAVSGPGTVVLPREVGLALRGGRVHRAPDREPPALPATARRPALVAGGSAEAAAEAVRLVDALCSLWSSAPPPVLRAGGVGVRELRRTGTALEVDERTTALVVELAHAAGLVADDGDVEPRWLPTPAYDDWREEDVPRRWRVLAAAWLATTRVPGLVGSRDARDAPRNALGADLDRAAARAVRREVLDLLVGAPVDHAVEADAVVARLRWQAPRRTGRLREDVARWSLGEAGWLGVLGAGALSAAGRALLAGDEQGAEEALAAALPVPVTEVLLQADLTAVAPGPLRADLAVRLGAVARVESRGGATVYRFDDASVRRGLDEGLTADDVLSFLAGVSATPVPQPLEYLVRDVARRHGRVRVGRAGAYVRAEDPALLAQLVADRRCAGLGLRLLAPTVLAAAAGPEEVLAALRAAGVAPAAEGPDGELLVRAAEQLRTPPRSAPRPAAGEPGPPAPVLLTAAVRALRAGDEDAAASEQRRAAHADAPPLPPLDPATSLALLREAAGQRRAVWVGYVDADGLGSRHLVEPVGVDGGRVTAYDRASGAVRSFSVHRVTGVAAAG